MSNHDQDEAIGALTRRFSDARKARAALVASLATIRRSMDRFSRTLAPVEGFNPSSNAIPRMPSDYPSDARVAATLDQLRSACEELELTERLLKEAGVDLS